MENDLLKLMGIGPNWTAAREKAGVDSNKELANRNAESLSKIVTDRKGATGKLSPTRARA